MKGLMQEWPLLVNTFIDHAKIHHGEREIVTRKVEVIINAITKPKVKIITGRNLDLKITLNKFFIILYLLK